ncbi:MAG: tRNA 2-thiouridine(34) synthase MnmA [Deltaproteobacteria bacterium]|nr:tRNA 2-thiouridine(34) synthase MnmA [Deltaproteobacteria bacterium]
MNSNASTTVVVGMSGGVDSSVAALLLRQAGYRVIGLFMKNWEEKDEQGVCTSAAEYADVVRVCEKLDIPYYAVEFVQEYWDNVFTQFVAEYKAGYTPNPDVLCNREIKFNVFLKKAIELKADYLATGHYCQKGSGLGGDVLLKGADGGKDQSYFVYTLNKDILSKVMFPIGHMQKPQLRELARQHGLPTHDKKDSTGICFIGERDFKKFLGQYVALNEGDFRNLDGRKVGRHTGAAYYTLGQRRGLGLGGEGDRWFVVGKDIATNTVFVERGELHPALYCDYLTATEPSWVSGQAPGPLPFRCKAKVRYRQPDQECTITGIDAGVVRVEFSRPQRAVTPRQSVVFYEGEVCLGGALIADAGPSYHAMNKPIPPEEPNS